MSFNMLYKVKEITQKRLSPATYTTRKLQTQRIGNVKPPVSRQNIYSPPTTYSLISTSLITLAFPILCRATTVSPTLQ